MPLVGVELKFEVVWLSIFLAETHNLPLPCVALQGTVIP